MKDLKAFCKKYNLTEAQATGKEKINGSLYLRSLTSIPEGFNPTVGGWLYLSSGEKYIGASVPDVYFWRDKKYIKADGIFQEVVSHRGNVYRVRYIGESEVTYLVTDGNGKWAHGDTLKEAKADLVFKITDRDKSQYEGLTLDDTLTYEEAMVCYRVITGACAAGTKGFVTSLPKSAIKKSYTIREIIELTEGQYGSDAFKSFFN